MPSKQDRITNEAYIIKVCAHLMLPEKYCHKQFQRINTNVIHSDQTRTVAQTAISCYEYWNHMHS